MMTQKQKEVWRNSCAMLMEGVRENLDAKIDMLSGMGYAWRTARECEILRERKNALKAARKTMNRLTQHNWEKFIAYTQGWTGELYADFVEITTVGGNRDYMEVIWIQN